MRACPAVGRIPCRIPCVRLGAEPNASGLSSHFGGIWAAPGGARRRTGGGPRAPLWPESHARARWDSPCLTHRLNLLYTAVSLYTLLGRVPSSPERCSYDEGAESPRAGWVGGVGG
jgi:hypothetical protein